MKFFRSYEIVISTRRSRQSVIKSLLVEASFNGDAFKIPAKVFSFRRGSKIEGEIKTRGDFTVVKARVLPSGELKAFSIFSLLLIGIVSLVVTVEQLSSGKADLQTLLIIPGGLIACLVFWGMANLIFLFSYQIQKALIENLVIQGE